ncbi:hypothetical protein BOC55_18220 [Burkholderia pseudomallei]|nr:hypothetical protein BOC54_06425 [Burkholderia pseudomallei]ARL80995.1 hypothetical protein BOC55_18220 [Burkholderia pseudomallei]
MRDTRARARLPSAVCRLPSAVCRLPSAVCRLPSAVCRRQTATTARARSSRRAPATPTAWASASDALRAMSASAMHAFA